MYWKLAKIALPLVVLAVIAAVTIGSSCCTPAVTLPPLTIGGFPLQNLTIPEICM